MTIHYVIFQRSPPHQCAAMSGMAVGGGRGGVGRRGGGSVEGGLEAVGGSMQHTHNSGMSARRVRVCQGQRAG